jgi:hypothetical protein
MIFSLSYNLYFCALIPLSLILLQPIMVAHTFVLLLLQGLLCLHTGFITSGLQTAGVNANRSRKPSPNKKPSLNYKPLLNVKLLPNYGLSQMLCSRFFKYCVLQQAALDMIVPG